MWGLEILSPIPRGRVVNTTFSRSFKWLRISFTQDVIRTASSLVRSSGFLLCPIEVLASWAAMEDCWCSVFASQLWTRRSCTFLMVRSTFNTLTSCEVFFVTSYPIFSVCFCGVRKLFGFVRMDFEIVQPDDLWDFQNLSITTMFLSFIRVPFVWPLNSCV